MCVTAAESDVYEFLFFFWLWMYSYRPIGLHVFSFTFLALRYKAELNNKYTSEYLTCASKHAI